MSEKVTEFVLNLLPETAEDLFELSVETATAFGKMPLASCKGHSLAETVQRCDQLLRKSKGGLVVRLYSQISTGCFREAFRIQEEPHAQDRLDPSPIWGWGSSPSSDVWSDSDEAGLIEDAVSVRDALLAHLRAYDFPGELPLAWSTSGLRPRAIVDPDEAKECLEAAVRERRLAREREARDLWS